MGVQPQPPGNKRGVVGGSAARAVSPCRQVFWGRAGPDAGRRARTQPRAHLVRCRLGRGGRHVILVPCEGVVDRRENKGRGDGRGA